MATTTSKGRKLSSAGQGTGPNLQASVETIGDINLRIKALEGTYGLKGQLCWSMNLTHELKGNAMIWNVGMTHIDGREIVPQKTGSNPLTLTNIVFREAARTLKAEYGPQAANGEKRRTA